MSVARRLRWGDAVAERPQQVRLERTEEKQSWLRFIVVLEEEDWTQKLFRLLAFRDSQKRPVYFASDTRTSNGEDGLCRGSVLHLD